MKGPQKVVKTVAVFPGQGASRKGFVLDSLSASLPPDAGDNRSITAVGVGTMEELQARGFSPDIALGHSAGELPALVSAGLLTKVEALRVVDARDEEVKKVRDPNLSMVPVRGDKEVIAAISTREKLNDGSLHRQPAGSAFIAAYNSSNDLMLSGQKDAVLQVIAEANKQYGNRFSALVQRAIDERAFHSPYMLSAASAFASKAVLSLQSEGGKESSVPLGSSHPRIRVVSSLTGEVIDRPFIQTEDYWRDHMVMPVCFLQAVREAFRVALNEAEKENSASDSQIQIAFIEIGPKFLHRLIETSLEEPLREVNEERRRRQKKEIDLCVLSLGGNSRNSVSKHDFDATLSKLVSLDGLPLRVPIDLSLVQQHRVGGKAVVPAVTQMKIFADTASLLQYSGGERKKDGAVILTDVRFTDFFIVSDSVPERGNGKVRLEVKKQADILRTPFSRATVKESAPPSLAPPPADWPTNVTDVTGAWKKISAADLYTCARARGLEWGTRFQQVEGFVLFRRLEGAGVGVDGKKGDAVETRALLKASSSAERGTGAVRLSDQQIDAGYQVVLASLMAGELDILHDGDGHLLLPTRAQTVIVPLEGGGGAEEEQQQPGETDGLVNVIVSAVVHPSKNPKVVQADIRWFLPTASSSSLSSSSRSSSIDLESLFESSNPRLIFQVKQAGLQRVKLADYPVFFSEPRRVPAAPAAAASEVPTSGQPDVDLFCVEFSTLEEVPKVDSKAALPRCLVIGEGLVHPAGLHESASYISVRGPNFELPVEVCEAVAGTLSGSPATMCEVVLAPPTSDHPDRYLHWLTSVLQKLQVLARESSRSQTAGGGSSEVGGILLPVWVRCSEVGGEETGLRGFVYTVHAEMAEGNVPMFLGLLPVSTVPSAYSQDSHRTSDFFPLPPGTLTAAAAQGHFHMRVQVSVSGGVKGGLSVSVSIPCLKRLGVGCHVESPRSSLSACSTRPQTPCASVQLSPDPAPAASQGTPIRGVHVVSGGSEICQSLAAFLVSQGADRVVLLSRSPSFPDGSAQGGRMEGRVVRLQCDVGSLADVESVFERLAGEGGGVVRGVWHLAAVKQDKGFRNVEKEHWEQTFRPKVDGIINLDRAATRFCPSLDVFVLFSSVAAAVGNTGQTTYAAANSTAEAVVAKRRARNDRASFCVSLQWGPWAEQGMAAQKEMLKLLADKGFDAHSNSQFFRALAYLLKQPLSSLPSEILIQTFLPAFLQRKERRLRPFFSTLAPPASPQQQSQEGALRKELTALRRKMLQHQAPVFITESACAFAGDINSAKELWRACSENRSGAGQLYDPDTQPFRQTRHCTQDGMGPGAYLSRKQLQIHGVDRPAERAAYEYLLRGDPKHHNALKYVDPLHQVTLARVYEILVERRELVKMQPSKKENKRVLRPIQGAERIGVITCRMEGQPPFTYDGTPEAEPPHEGVFSAATCVGPNIVSHMFGLKGPSFHIDQACSSSAQGLLLAQMMIRGGQADRVVVIGESFMGEPFTQKARSKRMLSQDGRCKSLDERADGYGRGEGVAVVLVERADLAEEWASRVGVGEERLQSRPLIALIGAHACSTGPRTYPSAPSAHSQAENAKKALQQARECLFALGFSRAQAERFLVDLYDLHSTGTKVGDLPEIEAVRHVVEEGDGKGPVSVSLATAVKPAINHTEAAAALAGVLNTSESLIRRQATPVVGLEVVHKQIKKEFERAGVTVCHPKGGPYRLPSEEECRQRGQPLTAVVNSFGFLGSEVCLVLALLTAEDRQKLRECWPAV